MKGLHNLQNIENFDVLKINYNLTKLLLTLKNNYFISNITFNQGSYQYGNFVVPTLTFEGDYESIEALFNVYKSLQFLKEEDITFLKYDNQYVELKLFPKLETYSKDIIQDLNETEIEYLVKYQYATNIQSLDKNINTPLNQQFNISFV